MKHSSFSSSQYFKVFSVVEENIAADSEAEAMDLAKRANKLLNKPDIKLPKVAFPITRAEFEEPDTMDVYVGCNFRNTEYMAPMLTDFKRHADIDSITLLEVYKSVVALCHGCERDEVSMPVSPRIGGKLTDFEIMKRIRGFTGCSGSLIYLIPRTYRQRIATLADYIVQLRRNGSSLNRAHQDNIDNMITAELNTLSSSKKRVYMVEEDGQNHDDSYPVSNEAEVLLTEILTDLELQIVASDHSEYYNIISAHENFFKEKVTYTSYSLRSIINYCSTSEANIQIDFNPRPDMVEFIRLLKEIPVADTEQTRNYLKGAFLGYFVEHTNFRRDYSNPNGDFSNATLRNIGVVYISPSDRPAATKDLNGR